MFPYLLGHACRVEWGRLLRWGAAASCGVAHADQAEGQPGARLPAWAIFGTPPGPRPVCAWELRPLDSLRHPAKARLVGVRGCGRVAQPWWHAIGWQHVLVVGGALLCSLRKPAARQTRYPRRRSRQRGAAIAVCRVLTGEGIVIMCDDV